MYAYEYAFSDRETQAWLDRQRRRYTEYRFGLRGVFCAIRVRMIGRCGDTMQDCDGVRVPEVRYLLERTHWHRGYAAEAVAVCRDYAFTPLGFDEVFSIIRDTNLASQRVAQPISMEPREMFVEHDYGVDMPHIYFSIRRM